MPELPEVETTVRGLQPLVGSAFTAVDVRVPRLRLPVPTALAAVTVGQPLVAVRRRAKYGLMDFAGGQTLIFHLGMSGRMSLLDQQEPYAKHDHIIWQLANQSLRFNDPRRFGLVALTATQEVVNHRLISHLGPEPLTEDFPPAGLYAVTRNRQQPIKVLIMDAKTVVGVGNIYACEALFRAGIRPDKPASKLTKAQCEKLVAEIKAVLTEAIAAGGSTLRDYANTDGKLGYFYEQFRVYGRAGQPCLACGTEIGKQTLGQRGTFWCAGCQR